MPEATKFKAKPECGRNLDSEVICEDLTQAKNESWKLLASGATVRLIDAYDGTFILQKIANNNSRFRWESDPVGLPFKIALQLRFEEMSPDALKTRKMANEGLSRETTITWARRWAPFIEDYYFKKTGAKLTGKALYQLVLNAKFYAYDKKLGRGFPRPGPSYIENRQEWFDLVNKVAVLSAQVTQEELRSLGAPYLAWLHRFETTRKPEPKTRLF